MTAVQKEWAGDCKDFLRQLIPRTSPVDVHASKGAVEAMMHSLEGLTRTSKGDLGRGSGNLDPAYLSDPAAGETSELPTKPICCTSVRQNIFRRVDHVKGSESSDQLWQFWRKSLGLERANWALRGTLVFGWADRQGQMNTLSARDLE